MAGIRSQLVHPLLAALCAAVGSHAIAEVRPGAEDGAAASGGVDFKIMVREYLEFRVGTLVTIRSNAGQVVITVSEPGTSGSEMKVLDGSASRSSKRARTPAIQKAIPRSVLPASTRKGATNVCLYLEGSQPSCGDLKEVAGRVRYTATNP